MKHEMMIDALGIIFWHFNDEWYTEQEWQEKLLFNEVHITTIKEQLE